MSDQNVVHALGCLILLQKMQNTAAYRKGSGLLNGYAENLSGAVEAKPKQRKQLACMDARIVGCRLGAALGFNSSSPFEF